MIKFIASDMDGTLLNENDEIHEDFYGVLNTLKEKDIIFAAASGRQYYNLLEKFHDVKDDMMFIAENGTFVVYKGEELLVNAMDSDVALELIKIGRTIKNSYIVLCGKKSAYIENCDERFLEQVKRYYSRYEIVEDLTKIQDVILKVTILDFDGPQTNSENVYIDYKEKLQVTVSGNQWLDITANGANKGVAIKKLQKILNIKYEETMAFGDYLNDLEMLESVYHSYAMENAHEDIKEVARFMAKSNNDNGVVEKIKEILGIFK